jgi:hypothetical protein
VVFKLEPSGKETVLHAFTGGADGAYPNAGLHQDEEGNLYGTAPNGGDVSCLSPSGCGVVFKVAFHHDGESAASAEQVRNSEGEKVAPTESARKQLQKQLRFGLRGGQPTEPQ